MKRFISLFLVLASLGLATSTRAQLVHLTIEGTVTEKFGGDAWWTGSGSGVGATALLHVYYDSQTRLTTIDPPGRESGGEDMALLGGDPLNNYWRLEFGQLNVSAPLDSIAVATTAMFLNTLLLDSLTTFELQLEFASDLPLDQTVPAPPFPPLAPRSPEDGLTGYASTFTFDTLSAGGLGGGSIVVGIDTLRAELIPATTPVPEASTYGYGAALLLGLAVLARRKRRA